MELLCSMVMWWALNTRMAATVPGCATRAADTITPLAAAPAANRPAQRKIILVASGSSKSCEALTS